MKKIIFITLMSVVFAAACGTAKQTADSKQLQKDELMRLDTLADIMPIFQGGDINTFAAWLQAQLQYPDWLLREYINGHIPESSLQGKVIAIFCVEKDGSVKNALIQSSPHPDLGKLLKNIILKSPTWTPGYQNNVPVRVRYVVPIEFRLLSSHLDQLRRQRNAQMTSSRNVDTRSWE
jgi:hypothetical protein